MSRAGTGGMARERDSPPEPEHDEAENTAGVLEEVEERLGGEHGQWDEIAEGGKMAIGPVAIMGERVPEEMGGRADEDRRNDEGEAAGGVDGKGERAEAHALAKALRHPAPQGLFGVAMVEPEKNEGHGQIDDEDSAEGVAEGGVRSHGEAILEVGHEAAGDKGGGKEPGAAKGDGRRCMGKSKGHSSYYAVGG